LLKNSADVLRWPEAVGSHPVPFGDAALIYAGADGELFPRQPSRPAGVPERLWKAGGRFDWRIPEEIDDPRDEVHLGLAASGLPVADAVGIDAQKLSNLSLEEPQVESALAEVVAERFDLFRATRFLRFSGT